jgi:DNA-binding MarR family transcriptional regulator
VAGACLPRRAAASGRRRDRVSHPAVRDRNDHGEACFRIDGILFDALDRYIVLRYIDPVSTPRLSDADYVLLAEFRHELRRFLAFSEAEAKVAGLTPQQHQLLLAVRAASDPPTVGFLAERLVLRHHSVVELINRLEERGLLVRTRSLEDGRQAHVSITAAGERVLVQLTLAHRGELRRAAPSLVGVLQRLSAPAQAESQS